MAQAVDAGELSADLLPDLQAEFEASQAKLPEQSHADAVRDIASELGMPVKKVEAGLGASEVQPRVVREVLMRRIAEALSVLRKRGAG